MHPTVGYPLAQAHLAGLRHQAQPTFPAGIAADPGTHTVHVANFGSGKTATVPVPDAGICKERT